MDPSHESWWWEHALDGIGSGLLAVLGVLGTLWFDRRARRGLRQTQDEAEGKAAARRLLAVAVPARRQMLNQLDIQRRVPSLDEVTLLSSRVQDVLDVESYLLRREQPQLLDNCNALMTHLAVAAKFDPEAAHACMLLALDAIREECDLWLVGPPPNPFNDEDPHLRPKGEEAIRYMESRMRRTGTESG